MLDEKHAESTEPVATVAEATMIALMAAARHLSPRDLLDVLDTYMANPTVPIEHRRDLWDILVALRGADRKRDRRLYGHDVAAPVRAQAFPRLALSLEAGSLEKRKAGGFRPTLDLDTPLEIAHMPLRGDGHYEVHARRGIEALKRWSSPLAGTQVRGRNGG